MRIVITDEPEDKPVKLALVQDGSDINVTANGENIGWFEVVEGRIKFWRFACQDTLLPL